MNAAPRVHLAGTLCVEAGSERVTAEALPGRQGRLLLACLALEHGPLPRERLAGVLWPETLPAAWETALSALVSKLRTALAPAGAQIVSAAGCYTLEWPAGTWIDVERAAAALDEAEGALRAGAARQAWGPAQVAGALTARPLLPELSGEWIEEQRARLRRLRLRSLDCLAEVWIACGEAPLAVQAASEAVELEPFRETGWRLLMRAHDTAGDVAEALRAYERCRRLLADELGVDPSRETAALHHSLLARR